MWVSFSVDVFVGGGANFEMGSFGYESPDFWFFLLICFNYL